MNLDSYNQRRDFLSLKVNAGLPLTPEEQAEFDRIKSVRVVQTTDNVLIVEHPPMTVEQWREHAMKRNAEARERADAERDKQS